MINLTTKFCGVKFSTPFVSVSGIVVDLSQNINLASIKGVGGITTKSISLLPREGHAIPRVASFGIGYLNSVGLKNPGVEIGIKEIVKLKKITKKPIIASIVGFQLQDFPLLAEKVAKAEPNFIELNLSCPNVDDEIGKPFATDPLLSAIVVLEVKKVVKNIPIIVKLTPNTPDIKKVAHEVEEAGADAISGINTVGPGMLIDINKGKPILGARVGGVSGPAVKPIALRCINDIYKTVKIPIIGMGGISSGKDAIEMIMAGATLVGIGSAVYQYGQKVFDKILLETKTLMQEKNISSLKKIRGIV